MFVARACLGVIVLGFSAVFSMLSNISFVLETDYAVSQIQTSLLIGSVPMLIIGSNGGVAFLD